MDWLHLSLYALLAVLALAVLGFGLFIGFIIRNYLGVVSRIFEEPPLFVIPDGQPVEGSEEVRFRTADGLTLAGSYLCTAAPRRLGVILFGPEFGSTRWTCAPYCELLLAEGYDVFTFDFRNTGESDSLSGYEPLQWVTNHEVSDMQAAVAYLKNRPDAPPEGIGLFGISRGGCTGILVSSRDTWIRGVVTDGAFATRSTMIPYMRKWAAIYSPRLRLQYWLPIWIYAVISDMMLRNIAKRRNCRYPSLRNAIRRIAPRPLFMIHGGADTYIKPPTARELFESAGTPKEFWLVEGARHNQALNVSGPTYHQRILEFFNRCLVSDSVEQRTPIRERSATPIPVTVS